jgi:hypothetical protein
VVGIVLDDEVIAVPEPVVAEAGVVGSDGEIKAAEPEAAGAASGEVPDVATADGAGEASVLPRMIEVVVSVATTGVVADPFVVGMDVRGVGVTSAIVKVTVFRGRMRRARWSGAVGGNVSAAVTVMLGEGY